jgi:hypothetical protein
MGMHRLVLALFLSTLAGCAAVPPYGAGCDQATQVVYANPSLIGVANPDLVWENVEDVIDDYFQVRREEPVRQVGDVLTEGRLETFPAVGATLFEPWRHDSANSCEKLESTLQSIRRYAVVRVIPSERGYWVDVTVSKELEDVVSPSHSTPGRATFQLNAPLSRVVNPVCDEEIHAGWIPRGRDTALEQRILEQLLARFSAPQPQ